MAKRLKTKTKKGALRSHFKKRLSQRYEIEISDSDVEFLLSQIRINNFKLLDRQSNNRSLVKFLFKDKEVFAIYDKKFGEFATAITLEQMEERFSQCLVE